MGDLTELKGLSESVSENFSQSQKLDRAKSKAKGNERYADISQPGLTNAFE